MVGLGRLELPTSRLSSARSNQLSYKPVFSAFSAFPAVSAFRRSPASVSIVAGRDAEAAQDAVRHEVVCKVSQQIAPPASLERR